MKTKFLVVIQIIFLYLFTGSLVNSFADDDDGGGIAQTQVGINIASLDINGIKALSVETLSLLTYTQCVQLTDRLIELDELLDDEVKLKLFLNLDPEKFKTIFVEKFDKKYKDKDYKKFEKELEKELKEFYKAFLPDGIKAKVKVKKGQIRIKFEVDKKHYKKLHAGLIQWLDFDNFKAEEILELLADLSEVELRQLSYHEWVWLILNYLDEKLALKCSGDNDDNDEKKSKEKKKYQEECSEKLLKIKQFFPKSWTIEGDKIQLTLEEFSKLAEKEELLELLGKKIAWFDVAIVGYFSKQQREEIDFVGLPKIYFAMFPDEARSELSNEAKAAFILSVDDLERISVQDLPTGWEYVVVGGKNKLKLKREAVEQLSLEFIAALTSQHFALFDAAIMKYLSAEQFIQINSEVLANLEIEYLEQIAESIIAELPAEEAVKYFVSLNFKQFEQKFQEQYGKDYAKQLEKFCKKLVPAGWKVKKKEKHGEIICQFKPTKETLQWIPQEFVHLLNFESDEGEGESDIVALIEGLLEEQLITELSSEQLESLPTDALKTIKDKAPLASIQIFSNLDIQTNPTILTAFTPTQEEIETLPLENLADEQLTTLIQRVEPEMVTIVKNKLPPPKLVQVLLNLDQDHFETKNLLAPTGWIIEPNTIELTSEAASEQNLTGDIIQTFTGEQINKFKPQVFQYLTANQVSQLSPSAVSGLTAPMVANLDLTAISGLTAPQLSALSPEAILGLDSTKIAHLNVHAVSGLTAEQLALVPIEAMGGWQPATFAALSPPALKGFITTQVLYMFRVNPAIRNAITVEQWEFMPITLETPVTVDNETTDSNETIIDGNINKLTEQQLAQISPDSVKEFTVEQITQIPPEAFRGLTAEQAAALQPVVVAGLTAEQFSFIPPAAFEQITAEQVAALQPETLKTLTAEQFANLPPQAFRGLTAEIITGPLASALTYLRAEQLAEIPPKVMTGLTTESIKNIPLEALKGFTSDQLSYLDNQTKTTFLTQRLSTIPDVAVLGTQADGQVVLEMFSEQPDQQTIVGLFDPVVEIDSACEAGITVEGEVGVDQRAILCYGDGTKQTMMPVVQDYTDLQQATDALLAAMNISERIDFQFHEDGTAEFTDLSGTQQRIVPEFEITLETTTEPEAEPVIHILNDEITQVELIVNAQSQVLHLSPSQSDDSELNKAQVDEIEILILESFPVQVQVLVKGNFTNGCEQIKAINTERQDNTFIITITTHFVGEICTQALVPFEETIPLEVEGLPAGIYTVEVHGLTATFELTVDNVVPTTP